jgi:hypothetical protein
MKTLMRKVMQVAVAITACVVVLFSCRKNAATEQVATPSEDALNKIYNLGFSNKNVTIDEDGNYVVEGDIVLSQASLDETPDVQFFRVGSEEQYRTTNRVTGLPRTITVSLDARLPSSYVAALDEALGRFNAEGLRVTFQRVSSGAAIAIVRGNGNFLASAGFPTSTGNPYNQVKVNSNALNGQPQATVASVLAHELGHCIGFRHTDYMNRSFSCGGSPVNEGASTVGAVLIPGTPAAADPNSWMLSCIGSQQNRPFNANDKIALGVLYK